MRKDWKLLLHLCFATKLETTTSPAVNISCVHHSAAVVVYFLLRQLPTSVDLS